MDASPKVALFPPAPADEPAAYLSLLRTAVETAGGSFADATRLTPAWAREAEVDAVHLHWIEFLAGGEGTVRAAVRAARLVRALRILRRRRVGIVWTVHNLRPHEPVHPRIEAALARAVLRASDEVIVHSRHAAERVRAEIGEPRQASVVPHGNYVGAYAPGRPRAEARRRLGIPEDAFVFLSFGQIRPYKRLPALVSAFQSMRGDRLRLLVAGEPRHDAELELLRRAAAEDRRVVLELRRIPDSEVAELHAAADAAVLPYREVFSSGALLLALSQGLPVVAAGGGSADEVAAPPAIEAFAPGRLADAMTAIAGGDQKRRRAAARAAAERFGWERIGALTLDAYIRAARAEASNAAVSRAGAAS